MTKTARYALVVSGLLLHATALANPATPEATAKAPGEASDSATQLADALTNPNQMMQSFVENGHDGDWVEYARYVDDKPSYASTLRMMLLKDTDPTEPDWVEIWLDKVGAQAVRLRSLADGKSEILFKMGKAIYVIEDQTTESAGPMCLTGTCGSAAAPQHGGKGHAGEVKMVSVKTLAGTFDCKYVKRQTKAGPLEVWYSDSVPGLGLVRMKSFGQGGLELVAYGRAGKTAFPAKFKPNAFPLQKIGSIGPMLPGVDKALTNDLRALESGKVTKDEKAEEPQSCEPGMSGCAPTPAAPPPTK